MSTSYQDPALLIAEAAQQGITLQANGDRLKVRGPDDVLTRWAPTLKANKPALLAYLLQCQQPEPDLRPVGEYTGAVATDAALGRPAGVESTRHQRDGVALRPTHRTTAPLLFHQPGHGPFIVPTRTPVHVFPSLLAARSAGLSANAWEGLGEWAYRKNTEHGYCVAWVADGLRGIHPDHLEQLPERRSAE
jgi:hypothetical protein